MNVGLLVIRVVVGLLFVGHGTQKLFGWFGGHGYRSTQQMMDKLGMQPPEAWTPLVIASEFGGGVATALGLAGPLGPLATMGSMTMATLTVHRGKPIWSQDGGAELPLLNIGAWSLDHALSLSVAGDGWALAELAAGLLGAVGAVVGGRLVGSRRQSARGPQATAA